MKMNATNISENPKIIGLLYGTQSGRKIIIKTTFEALFTIENGVIVIDKKYIESRKELYSQIFKDHDIVGWYRTGDQITQEDIQIHQEISSFCENPLFLICDTIPKQKQKQLPVLILEQNVITDNGNNMWSYFDYSIQTEDSERISVEYLNSNETFSSSASSSISQFTSLSNAVTILNDNIQIIISYLNDVKNGKIKKDYNILRKISSLCNSLPKTHESSSDYVNNLNEVLLVVYLTSITKRTNILNEVVEKYNTSFERKGRRTGMGDFY